jgi:uncharacterized protein YjbJ (UPF0337 family)
MPRLAQRDMPAFWRVTMNRDQVQGKAKDIAGKVQEKVGQVTGSTSERVKGVAKRVEGTVQKGVGNLEEARWSHKWRTINHPVPKQTLTRLSVHPEPIRSASDLVQLRVASQPLLLLRGLWLRDP